MVPKMQQNKRNKTDDAL